jgi:hypothetical protein
VRRKHLSSEERSEFDALFEEAGLDEFGNPRPAHEIKARMRRVLDDAVQAGRTWAQYVLDDALEDGLGKAWKGWNNEQRRMRTLHNGVIVPARAVRGTRRRDPETGQVVHQQSFWLEMSWEGVRQQLGDSRKRIDAERVTESIAARLLELLLDCPDSAGPADACERLGIDMQDYLVSDEAA